MNRQVNYTKRAVKDLQSLEYKVAKHIIAKVAHYSMHNNYRLFAKRLKGSELFRFRVSDYRIIFSIHINNEDKIEILNILKINHRKDIYKSI